MARKTYPQVSPTFLVIMLICPKHARATRSSALSTRKPFSLVLRLRRATPSAVRQVRLRHDQITTKAIGKQSSHQPGREATRDPLATLPPAASLLLADS